MQGGISLDAFGQEAEQRQCKYLRGFVKIPEHFALCGYPLWKGPAWDIFSLRSGQSTAFALDFSRKLFHDAKKDILAFAEVRGGK